MTILKSAEAQDMYTTTTNSYAVGVPWKEYTQTLNPHYSKTG